MTQILFLGLMFAAMYFLMIAPQRKKQKAHEKMLSELSSGDEIVTTGGIYGTITNVKDDRFVVRIALEGFDRRGLYADVAAAMSSTGTDIKSMELKSTDGRVTGAALVEVENLAHLQRIMKAARRVKGITEVARREHLTAEA